MALQYIYMIDDIMFTFDKNFLRINNLIGLYKSLAKGKGRKHTNSLDILRATTVLAHSTLEDYLRNLLIWKLPLESKEKINNIPLAGLSEIGRNTKFTLGDLVAHKGKSIDDVIHSSINEYLGKISFNNTTDISNALTSISLEITQDMKNIYPTLNEMIKRRHNIVHRADRSDDIGSGNHKVISISVQKVDKWKKSIDKLIIEINRNFVN